MTPPRLLLLETSGRRGIVALARGECVAGRRILDEGRRNARDLAPAVADLLGEQDWSARQLDAVVVSRGPGSYTGLRVGIVSAKALAYATGCALIAIDTFAAIARQAPGECTRLDVVADAQQQNVYVQSFAGAEPVTELTILPFSDWLNHRDGSAWVSGPGLLKWEGRIPAEVLRVPVDRREPAIESLLALGLERLRAGSRDDVFALEPLYLRASSAEIQWRGRS